MLKEHLYSKKLGADPHFRWRGGEMSRIEAISDAVFAITITLLIVSSASSDRFFDIWKMVRDLPAFFVSFILIIYAWFEHYRFFRRYGLEDGWTVILNALFLFLIMILAYPLKFLTTFLWYAIIGENTASLFSIPANAIGDFSVILQRKYMMYFYSLSIFSVFAVLALMHWHAYKKRALLELDKVEVFFTRVTLTHHMITLIIITLSLIVLYTTGNPGVSGIVYFLMPLIHFPVGWFESRKINALITPSQEKS